MADIASHEWLVIGVVMLFLINLLAEIFTNGGPDE